MRQARAIVTAAAFVLMAAGLVAQSRPSFSGDWIRDVQLGPDVLPEVELTISHTPAALTVEYKGGGDGPAGGKVTYQLDGSPSRNMVAGRAGGPSAEQIARATWAGNNVVVTVTTGAGEEKRTFSMDGDHLVVETSAPARSGRAPNVTRVTYKKYELGHGG
jgi:hypothetical protein